MVHNTDKIKPNYTTQDTTVLTKFLEDWATELNKTRVIYAPPHWKPYIIETNLLTKFHEDWTINVASRVLTRKNSPPLFHDDRKINVTSRVLTRKCHIQKTHVLTKFHEHWTKNVTSRVFPCFHYIHIEKTAPPPGGHVFSPIWTIFELIQEINKTNVLPNFMMIGQKLKTAPPTGGHVTSTVFTGIKLGRDFIGAKLLTKFHEDGTRNVASIVLTTKCLWTDKHTTDKDRSEKLT
ncbi:hypothetical protein DPMN_178574 [Dreissena polymorpha]|uniref:Uncharacterized protein n=1 Tax=Dreissena polymorpha TaxID=45954 RepID=A0A9D4EFH6_DREPO|nr:hypothetical protein DPMN_178574 [Dreissena polymorpha]